LDVLHKKGGNRKKKRTKHQKKFHLQKGLSGRKNAKDGGFAKQLFGGGDDKKTSG